MSLVDNCDKLVSADSLAWSFAARYGTPLDTCTHRKCASCYDYAHKWRAQLLSNVESAWESRNMTDIIQS